MPTAAHHNRRSIDEVLADGAVPVDIRPERQRAQEGELPQAPVVERNVLEWRFDPASSARLVIADYDLQVIVACSQGYTSSLAAAALIDLGVHRATDLDGGFAAWRAAGLPALSPRCGLSRRVIRRRSGTAAQGETHLARCDHDGGAMRRLRTVAARGLPAANSLQGRGGTLGWPSDE